MPEVIESTAEMAILVQGRVWRLPEGVWYKIGADRHAQIRVNHPHVSGRHAVIRRLGRRIEVLDSQSTNGVWWKGERREEISIEGNDVFLLGTTPVVVVEVGISEKYKNAYRWCDMVLMPSSNPLVERVARMAMQSDSVMVLGESGTGKEHIARAIHAMSHRSDKPFVALNCAALPDNLAEGELFGVQRGAFTGADRTRDGLFGRANGGTLFLDEVGELSPAVQSKLLRVLETQMIHPVGGGTPRRVDVRVITATWRSLEASTTFRHDLYQRLHILPVHLKPLRTRRNEIGPLLELFLRERRAIRFWPTDDQLALIVSADWPGNVRELRSRVIRCACTGQIKDLIPDGGSGSVIRLPRRGRSDSERTKRRILRCLELHHGNRSAAARELGISRSTLYRWLDRSG